MGQMAGISKKKRISFKLFHAKYKNRALYPLKDFASSWTFFLLLFFLILLLFGPILGKFRIYPGDFRSSQNRLYLLSAIAQSLATVLALGISAALISVQLVSQMFTPKVIKLKLRDFYFWFFIGLYIASIIWVLSLMGWLKSLKWRTSLDIQSMDIALLLTGASLLYLAPFIQITFKNLQPVVFINKFLAREEFQAVEEILHKAVNEGFSTIIRESGEKIRNQTIARMDKENKIIRLALAQKTASCYLSVGKRAHRKTEDECLFAIFENLKLLTEACTEKIWRSEADIFNAALSELYDFTQEKDL
jgi:hypothetical protein